MPRCHTFDESGHDHRAGNHRGRYLSRVGNNGASTMLLKRTNGFSRARRAFLAFSAVAVIAAAGAFSPYVRRAVAEAAPQGPGQVALTAKQIEQYLAAFPELTPLFEKLDQAGDKPDPKILAAVEATV